MLTILDAPTLSTGELTRREWLRVGSLGLGGLTLPTLAWEKKAAAAITGEGAGRAFGKAKSVLLFWLRGGPTQLETWDPKPNDPEAIRGDLGTISSRTVGLQVGELMPFTAKITDKVAVLRAVDSGDSSHGSSGYQMLTGVPHQPLNSDNNVAIAARNRWPSFGGIVRALREDRNGLPAAITLPKDLYNNSGFRWPGQTAGFLGRRYDPWLIDCDPSEENFEIPALALSEGVTPLRFDRRRSLLEQVNSHLDRLEADPAVNRYDVQARQALDLLGAAKSRQAFDLGRESVATRDRYGRTRFGQSVLLARRLIEAGVSLVQVNWTKMEEKPNTGDWDTHQKNTSCLKDFLMPYMDRAFSALIEDLDERGLLDETLVVWQGEFGRTPKINANGGRDHWGHCYSVAMAGAGVRGGAVFGSSDRHAAYPVEGRVTPRDLAATIFHCLGYPPETSMYDSLRRPMAINQGSVIDQIF